jgi:hypothetical protein
MINSTKNTYESAIKSFIAFGGGCPCKPSKVISYIETKGGIDVVDRLKVKSLRLHLSAIKAWHLDGGFNDPTNSPQISKALKQLSSLERQNGIYKDDSRFMSPEECLQIVALLIVMDDTLISLRDRIIVGIAILTGYRPGMIARIKVGHLINLGVSDSNIIIDTTAFKTDNDSIAVIPFTGIQFCPATWIREFVFSQSLTDGYLFRGTQIDFNKPLSHQTINTRMQRIFSQAGIVGGKLTSYSCRKTMATIAAMEGVSIVEIAAQGGWSSVDTIQKHYIGHALSLMGNAPKSILNSIARVEMAISNGGVIEGGNKYELETSSRIIQLSDAEEYELYEKLYFKYSHRPLSTINSKGSLL